METAMELDDLKRAWQTLDQRVQAQSALNLHMFKDSRLDKMRHGLRPLFLGQLVQIQFGVLMAGLGIACWTGHGGASSLFAAGIALHLYGVVTIIFAGVTIAAIHGIDYAGPVLEIQKQLAKLRRIYILNGACTGLPWWLLWIVAVLAAFGLAGIDIAARAPEFVPISLAVGVAGFAGSLSLALLARAPGGGPIADFLNAGMTGASLRRAQSTLDEIARFEQA